MTVWFRRFVGVCAAVAFSAASGVGSCVLVSLSVDVCCFKAGEVSSFAELSTLVKFSIVIHSQRKAQKMTNPLILNYATFCQSP